MSNETLKAGHLLKVAFEVRLPAAATFEEAEAWLRFNVGDNGSLSGINPLIHESVETWGGSFEVEDTGYVGREERLNERKEGAVTYYTLRHHRERAA